MTKALTKKFCQSRDNGVFFQLIRGFGPETEGQGEKAEGGTGYADGWPAVQGQGLILPISTAQHITTVILGFAWWKIKPGWMKHNKEVYSL